MGLTHVPLRFLVYQKYSLHNYSCIQLETKYILNRITAPFQFYTIKNRGHIYSKSKICEVCYVTFPCHLSTISVLQLFCVCTMHSVGGSFQFNFSINLL